MSPSSNWKFKKTGHKYQKIKIQPKLHLSKPKSNLDKGERDALKELSEQANVIITNSNKGVTVVIWEIKDYINEANIQLNVTFNYKNPNQFPNDLMINSQMI